MNIKILVLFLLLTAGFTSGSLLYNASHREEKQTDPFAQSPQDISEQPEATIAQPSFAPPSGISPGKEEQNIPGHNAPGHTASGHNIADQKVTSAPEKNDSPGVGQAIIQLACKTANAVGRAEPDNQQYHCDPSQTSSGESASDPNTSIQSPQNVNQTAQVATRADIDNLEDSVAAQTVPVTDAQATDEQAQPQTVQAAHIHKTVTGHFPANGFYRDSFEIDGWPVSCNDHPIEVIETFYEGTDPSGRGRYDGHKLSTFKTSTGIDFEGNEHITNQRLILSSALKTKRTLTKLYHFYDQCVAYDYPSSHERACRVAEKGKEDGWLTPDGVQFLCRETSGDVCQSLKQCFSGPPPSQTYTKIDSVDPLAQQYTKDFPPAGVYPPGSLNIDGIPARCENTPVRVFSAPGTNWLGTAILDENVIHLNRDNLINQSTAGKLAVFSDECAHITYQASNYEAACGSWVIQKQNNWIDDRNVEQYCRSAKENFYVGGYYLEHTSPEQACQRARGCYSGSIQPIQGSVWGR